MRTPLAGALAICVLFMICAPTIKAQSANQSINVLPPTQRHVALVDKAKTLGSVPVIVQLDSPAINKRGDAPFGRTIAHIKAIQSSVVSRLPQNTQVRRFKHIPFLSLAAEEQALKALLQMPEVVSIQEDEHYGVLLEESTAAIGAPAAWAYGGSGAGQVVAIIDSGVDSTHPFLEGKVAAEACFSSNYQSTSSDFESISICPNGEESAYGAGAAMNCDPEVDGCSHGTRVAGIVAGESDTFSGVAPGAGLLALQVFSRFENYCGDEPCVRSWISDQVAALDYIYQYRDSLNIAAVNLSLGGGHYTDEETCDEVNPAMRILIDMLHNAGIAVIAAAGNSGLTDGLVSPACITSAISVGATTKVDDIAMFSSSATFLDFLAPGQDIVTSVPGGGFSSSAGTSFSAPHVAGAWAILKASNPDATIEDLLATFAETGVPITDDRNNVTTSRIQVDLALQAVQLPVELVSFDAAVHNQLVKLQWVTANEINNAGFEVEYEVDGGYESLGFVAGQGTTTEETVYAYDVPQLAPGWHTFRLKQIDFDGQFAYSLLQQVFVEIDGAFHLGSAYPNPFNPQTQFTLTLATTQQVRVEVFNLLGAHVLTLANQELQANQRYTFTFDASHLANGIYLVQTVGESFRAVQSVTLLK